jgi:DNA mismatch repair protein MutS
MADLTPLMRQYLDIKKRYTDCILFFRMGDFYEMFFEDAKVAAKAMNIALTSRSKDKDEPMCGLPYHALSTYLARMVSAGHKVAICEQVEDPKEAKGLVKREVVRVVTPGTLTEDYLLDEKIANYLAALSEEKEGVGLAVVDLSTGLFTAREFVGERRYEKIFDELVRLAPREVIVSDSLRNGSKLLEVIDGSDFNFEKLDFLNFDPEEAQKRLHSLLGVSTLEGFGMEGRVSAVSAAGGAVGYIERQSPASLEAVTSIKYLHSGEEMEMDGASIRNLELVSNLADGSSEGTLISILDRTRTPMGARLLREWIVKPLKNLSAIQKRQSVVTSFFDNFRESATLQSVLEKVSDFERASGRIAGKNFNPRDFSSLANSLSRLPEVLGAVEALGGEGLSEILNGWDNLEDLSAVLEKAVNVSHPATFKEQGFIKDGYNADLDEVRSFCRSGADTIKEMEQAEKKTTGISSLKFGFNRIYGYYIEVTKKNIDKVPVGWIKKQSLVNCERYVSPQLKEVEEKLTGSEERALALETELVEGLRGEVIRRLARVAKSAELTARLDVAVSLSETARLKNYCAPELTEGDELELVESRHPVIESLMTEENFVPNDVRLDGADETFLIITGPNMAGKSTYLRQAALAVLMAQMGGYVAAHSAKIGVADRIFTRVGAQDRLQKGLSTFMVEMVETSNILNNATERSFVILDEIGRGTSTFDGVSIAWAVAEFLAEKGVRTLFATHYHELTDLAATQKGVANYNVSAKEYDDRLIFMRKVEEGPADKSYGIQVGRLAGLPSEVLKTARRVLADLERMEFGADGKPTLKSEHFKESDPAGKNQISLFENAPRSRRGDDDAFSDASDGAQGTQPSRHPVMDELLGIDINNVTPVEALKILNRLKELINNEQAN